MKTTRSAVRQRLAVGLTSGAVALVALVAAGAPSMGAEQEQVASPLGIWHAEGGAAQVEIAECDGGLCGRVTSLRSPFDESGCELRDANNPDPQQRSRPVLGLEILHAVEQPAGDRPGWTGTIYDPGSGRTYDCEIRSDGVDRLQLRGYIGVPLIGRTTTWFRVGREDRMCRDADPTSTVAPDPS
jgi:uncharacterized protein (DUF2147 family)